MVSGMSMPVCVTADGAMTLVPRPHPLGTVSLSKCSSCFTVGAIWLWSGKAGGMMGTWNVFAGLAGNAG